MMSGQTKMIIITSNEDIIRQFSSNKNTNTHIIDLDNDQQVMSEAKNNNMVNLALLAELSELNSNNDQIYKRVLDSPDHHRSKAAKVSKKSMDLVCTICGDRAIGFNYDVLSCASCKAFFRRNANQPSEKLRCLTGQGQCSVAHGTRRKCPRCRLDRCLAVGMRKDFILSADEKQRRKQRLEENRNNSSKRLSISESTNSSHRSSNSESISEALDEIDRLLVNMDGENSDITLHEIINSNEIENILFETLSVEDWMTIQTVQSSFMSFFRSPTSLCNVNFDLTDRASALISWSQFANYKILSFIHFFRQIDEFEGLDIDDRFILIKYNILPLFPISKSYNYTSTDDCCSREKNEFSDKQRQFFKLCGGSDGYRESFANLVLSLVQITEQDPALLSLLIIILLFSQGMSMSEDEPSLKDPLAVYRAQSHYTKVLWNYMVNKQGEMNTCKQFTQLLTGIFKIQSAAKVLRDFFRFQFTSSNTLDSIAPLLQTVLSIS